MAVKSVKQLVRDAGKSVEALSGQDAAKLVGDPGVLFVDVREGEELQKTGRLRGAVHVPRGLLEFQGVVQNLPFLGYTRHAETAGL